MNTPAEYCLLLLGSLTLAASASPPADVSLEQRLGELLPLETPVLDETGRTRTLGSFFGARPVILMFGYSRCPMLCTHQAEGLRRALRPLKLQPGADYRVLFLSLDPQESAPLSGQPRDPGWSFLRAGPESIARLTGAAGYRYRYDEASGHYAHPSGFFVLTPTGKISQVFFGLEMPSGSLQKALETAVGEKTGNPLRKLILRCFQYGLADSALGRMVVTTLRVGSVLTLLCLALFIARRGKGDPAAGSPCLVLGIFPEVTGDAAQVDAVFLSLVVASGLVVLLLCALVIWAVLGGVSPQFGIGKALLRHSMKVEVGWTAVTLAGFLVHFAFGAQVFFRLYQVPPGTEEVHVVGRQWMWQTIYENGHMEHNHLVIPEGQPVRLILSSEDVIHSFYVPAFRLKHDVVPGKYIALGLRPAKPGRYRWFCAEYCGTEHAKMTGWVDVLPPEQYAQWRASQGRADSLAAQGRELFLRYGCSGCHEPGGVIKAPNLRGIYGRQIPLATGEFVLADRAYIHDSITFPARQIAAGYENLMPSYEGILSEAQIVALTAYIASLPDDAR